MYAIIHHIFFILHKKNVVINNVFFFLRRENLKFHIQIQYFVGSARICNDLQTPVLNHII